MGWTTKAATRANEMEIHPIIVVVKALKVIAFTARKGHQICSSPAYSVLRFAASCGVR
jgi:hypothetical protein